MGITHELSEHAAENRRVWNDAAERWVEASEQNWAPEAPVWGQWCVPDSQMALLPERMSGPADWVRGWPSEHARFVEAV